MVWTWIIAGLLLAVVVADWCYRQFAATRIRDLLDNVPPFGMLTASSNHSAERLSIPANDGLTLSASLHLPEGEPRALILFSPELHGSHWTATHYCEGLIADGFAVLSYNSRNQGDSEQQANFEPTQWATETELSDLMSVLRFISQHPQLSRLSLGAFGVSRGGSQVLVAACRTSQIRAVATDSAYDAMSLLQQFIGKFSRYVVPDWFFNRLPKWHVDLVLRQALRKSEQRRQQASPCQYLRLEAEASGFKCPGFFISGQRDTYVSAATTYKIAKMLGRRETDVWIVSKARHNKARQLASDEYDLRLTRFFRTCLLNKDSAQPDHESNAAITSAN